MANWKCTRWNVSGGRDRQKGLSMVELMIALALGTLLTLGVAQVFIGSLKTYRTSDAVSFLQENLRFSLSRMSRDIRMAGHFGCLVGDPVEHLNTGNYDADFFGTNVAVLGWEAQGTGLGVEHTVGAIATGGGAYQNGEGIMIDANIANNAIPGNDVVMLNVAERENLTLTGNPDPAGNTIGVNGSSGINDGEIIVAVLGDCSGADRYQKNTNAASSAITRGNTTVPPNNLIPAPIDLLDHTNQSSIYVYRSRAYFIGVSADNDSDDQPVPALFEMEVGPNRNPPVPQELIQGVESMQILYGVAGANQRAQQYVTAANVANWDNVVSVRLALLMRSDVRVLDEESTATFNLVGTEVEPDPEDADELRVRLTGNMTIGIRNRLE